MKWLAVVAVVLALATSLAPANGVRCIVRSAGRRDVCWCRVERPGRYVTRWQSYPMAVCKFTR